MGWKDGKYYADSEYGMGGDIWNWAKKNYQGSTDRSQMSRKMNSMVTGKPVVTGIADREATLMKRANSLPKDIVPAIPVYAPKQVSKVADVVKQKKTGPNYSGMTIPPPALERQSAIAKGYDPSIIEARNQLSVDSPQNRGVGYYTALGGYNPEAMDNIYNGTYDAMQYNPDGMSYGNKYDPDGLPVIAQEAVAQQGAIPPNTTTPPIPPAPDNSFMSSIGNWWNSMSTPAGLTKEQFANLTEKERVAALGQKSGWENLGATMSGVGSMAGGLAGVYGAYANAKYQKDQANMQKAMIASDEANKSAFAKAAGGTYVGSGVR